MNKKKITMTGITVFIILIICLAVAYFIFGNIPMSKEEQKVVRESIILFDIDTLNKYAEEDIEVLTPIGNYSQIDAEISENPKLKEYIDIYKDNHKEYHNFYDKNTLIDVSEMYYNKSQSRFEQKIKIDSFSMMGYSIVFNDLLLFYMEALSNEYLAQGIEPESVEMELDTYTQIKTIALVYTNKYFTKNTKSYEREIILYWEKEDDKWICTNLESAINNLTDPEMIAGDNINTNVDVTEKFDKYHGIAVKIWEEIIFDEDWDINNPLTLIKKGMTSEGEK